MLSDFVMITVLQTNHAMLSQQPRPWKQTSLVLGCITQCTLSVILKISHSGCKVYGMFVFLYLGITPLMCSKTVRTFTHLVSQTFISCSHLFFGLIVGDTSYMSFGLVCLDGLGFLVRSQTCYRISHKAGGELGRPL